jgi:hypothetical protein
MKPDCWIGAEARQSIEGISHGRPRWIVNDCQWSAPPSALYCFLRRAMKIVLTNTARMANDAA